MHGRIGAPSGFALAVLVLCCGAAGSSATEPLPWTVRDSVQTCYLIDGDGATDAGFFANTPALPVVASPDGARFFVITRCGDLEHDQSVFTLRLYDTEAVAAAVRAGASAPAPIRQIETRSVNGMISDSLVDLAHPRWSDDGREIYYETMERAANPGAANNVQKAWFSFDVASGRSARQAAIPLDQLEYAVRAEQNIGIIARAHNVSLYVRFAEAQTPVAPMQVHYPAEPITAQLLTAFLGGQSSPPGRLALYMSRDGRERKLADLPDNFHEALSGAISPDGHNAIVALPRTAAQIGWHDNAIGPEQMLMQFMRVDLHRGTFTPLVNAPTWSSVVERPGTRSAEVAARDFRLYGSAWLSSIAAPPSVLWSPDSERVILVSGALPLTSDARLDAYVLSYDVAQGRYDVIAPMFDADQLDAAATFGALRGIAVMTAARWGDDGTTLVLDWGDIQHSGERRQRSTAFRLDGGVWQETDARPQATRTAATAPLRQQDIMSAQRDRLDPSTTVGTMIISDASWYDFPTPQPIRFANGLELRLNEAPNTPQTLVATIGQQSLTVLEADPHLHELAIAHTEIIEWRGPDNRQHRALLTTPLHASSARPPLVLQIYKFMPNVWRPDGYAPSGFARQALAARGMAVLEMSTDETPVVSPTTWENAIGAELPIAQSAIDEVVRRNLVDPQRIGVIGFSDSGFHARQYLTNPGRYRFMAAVANDSHRNDYPGTMRVVAQAFPTSAIQQNRLDFVNGRFPHLGWDDWERRADDLSAVYATGALLDISHSLRAAMPVHLFGDMAMSGAYRSAGRPYEGMLLVDGDHLLQRPRQRYASLSVNIDWMDFWLNGHEDPDSAKVDQYARWRRLRESWDIQQRWEAAGNPAGSTPAADFVAQDRTDSEAATRH